MTIDEAAGTSTLDNQLNLNFKTVSDYTNEVRVAMPAFTVLST